MSEEITVGILTVSDSCFRKESEDVSGRKLAEAVENSFPDYKILFQDIVPDEKPTIIKTLESWVSRKCNLILTTGGTGFSPRDVTPEATKEVIEREAPGIAFAMISKSLAVTPMAMLSRSVCGIKAQSIIINLPGSAKGAVECFAIVKPAISHAIALVTDKNSVVVEDHKKIHCPSRVSMKDIAGRPRESAFPMMEVDEALEIVIKESQISLGAEEIKIEDCLYRVLAENVESQEDLPNFDASIKDGYAVITSDGDGRRRVRNFVAAGDFPERKLQSGEVFRICTGAPIPEGADAVVQVEDTSVVQSEDGEEIEIKINKAPKLGQDIRLKGADMKKGDLVLRKGEYLKPPHIGILAALGKSRISVYKKPSIGVLTTGNELKNHDEKLEKGQIRDSNRLTLINLFVEHHFKCDDHGIVKDDPDLIKSAIAKALSKNDVLVTTGGVSMGEFDFVKRVLLEDFQAVIHFGRVNMKPGKPTTFATLQLQGRTKLVFGLPGNPVSAGVTSLLFVMPVLKRLENATKWEFATIPYVVSTTRQNLDPRPEYMRVVVSFKDGNVKARPNGDQISSRLNSLAGANGLLLMPGNMVAGKDYQSKIIMIDELV